MRQTGGSVVCSGCGRLVDVEEQSCPHCGAWRPGMFGYASGLRRAFADLDATGLIVRFCILLYLISLVLNPKAALMPGRGMFGLPGTPGWDATYLLGKTDGRLMQMGHWYTVFSATFLHGGLLHIFFNLMWTRQLGRTLEDEFGAARIFLIFALSGAGGFVVSNLMKGYPTIGASGAVFGLLATAIVYGRRRGGSFGGMVSQQAWVYTVVLFVLGLVMPYVNNWAHGGGFVCGWVISSVMAPGLNKPESPLYPVAAGVVALLTLGAIILSLVTMPAEINAYYQSLR